MPWLLGDHTIAGDIIRLPELQKLDAVARARDGTMGEFTRNKLAHLNHTLKCRECRDENLKLNGLHEQTCHQRNGMPTLYTQILWHVDVVEACRE